jgi:hypothetical protein
MNRLAMALGGMLFACGVSAAENPAASGNPPANYAQAWLGALVTDDSLSVAGPESGSFSSGLGTLPFGGGAAQRLWGDGAFQFGYEGGAIASWKNRDTSVFASSGPEGGTLLLTTNNRFFSVGVFMGAAASVDLTGNLRLMVAAGPSLTWARLDRADDEPTPQQADTIVVDGSQSASDLSLVAYGRIGLEVVLPSGFSFGASIRYANDDFDFGRSGQLEIDEVLWMLTLGSRL